MNPFFALSMTAILVISNSENNPLHIVVSGSTRYATAGVSLTQGYFDPDAHHITLLSNGQGLHYLTASDNAYYVGVDSSNNIQVKPESQFNSADKYTFRQEHLGNDLIRYYLETGGEKLYIMVGSDRRITTLNANNLVLGSQNDVKSRFTIFQI